MKSCWSCRLKDANKLPWQRGRAEFYRQRNSKCSEPVAGGGKALTPSLQNTRGWNPEDRHRPRAGSEAQKEVLARGAKLIRMERTTEAQLCLQNTAERLATVKSCWEDKKDRIQKTEAGLGSAVRNASFLSSRREGINEAETCIKT